MELVPGFMALVQGLAGTMTAPTFASLTTVLTGWVFAGRRTVTRMILAAGSAADKHYSSYHRLFSAARWSLDAVTTMLGTRSTGTRSGHAVAAEWQPTPRFASWGARELRASSSAHAGLPRN